VKGGFDPVLGYNKILEKGSCLGKVMAGDDGQRIVLKIDRRLEGRRCEAAGRPNFSYFNERYFDFHERKLKYDLDIHELISPIRTCVLLSLVLNQNTTFLPLSMAVKHSARLDLAPQG
jgi:hypothetical protein